ncbi:hypothetical protein T01_14601, partial [Trichinella spiralis]
LIAGYSVMDTLIHQVLSRNATVGDSKRQEQAAKYTGEYTNGRRTLEESLQALIFAFPPNKILSFSILKKLHEKMEQCQIEIHFHQPLDVIVLTPFTERRHQLKRMIKNALEENAVLFWNG